MNIIGADVIRNRLQCVVVKSDDHFGIELSGLTEKKFDLITGKPAFGPAGTNTDDFEKGIGDISKSPAGLNKTAARLLIRDTDQNHRIIFLSVVDGFRFYPCLFYRSNMKILCPQDNKFISLF